MSRGEVRAALGEKRLADLEAEATRLEITPQELLRRIVDWTLERRDEGWTFPVTTPSSSAERADRDVPGFVYLMAHLEEEHLYKIGFSVSPIRRLDEVSKAEKACVELVCSIPTSDMRRLERELHEQHARQRIRGEWFRLDKFDVEAIVRLARAES